MAQVVAAEFFQRQRWFGGKSRTIAATEVVDAAHLPGTQALLNFVEIRYTEGGADLYAVPMQGEADAITDPSVALALLALLENEAHLPTQRGFIQGRRSTYRPAHAKNLQTRVIGTEQSNSSIVFGDLLILKLFRRQHPGENPDCELSRYLAEQTRFPHIAPFAGSLDYVRPGVEPYTLAMLQGLVANEGDGWNWALNRMRQNADVSAQLLGQRTAELHLALARYAPEPLTKADLAHLADDMEKHAGPSRTFERLRQIDPQSQRIRIHGDYHLGQVLRTADDFVILDFEGEPSKTLAERRAKHCPLKDVAGMLRSFSYASYTVWPDAEGTRATWEKTVSEAFLTAYRQTARKAEFLPAREDDFQTLLNAYVLDKAYYELDYERNNRPDWVRIPMAAISAQHGENLP